MRGHFCPFTPREFQPLPSPYGHMGRKGEFLSQAPSGHSQKKSENGHKSKVTAVSALKGLLLSAVKLTKGRR